MRKTPKQKVADMLTALGYEGKPGYPVEDFDIHHVHGGAHKSLNDTIECWHTTLYDKNRREVQIYSGNTLTECARKGLVLEKNSDDTCHYGDLIAVPKELNNPLEANAQTPAGTKVVFTGRPFCGCPRGLIGKTGTLQHSPDVPTMCLVVLDEPENDNMPILSEFRWILKKTQPPAATPKTDPITPVMERKNTQQNRRPSKKPYSSNNTAAGSSTTNAATATAGTSDAENSAPASASPTQPLPSTN